MRASVLRMAAFAAVLAALGFLGVCLWGLTLPDVVTPDTKVITVSQIVEGQRHSQEVWMWMTGGAVALTVGAAIIAAFISSEIRDG